jgi:hypothetical protein
VPAPEPLRSTVPIPEPGRPALPALGPPQSMALAPAVPLRAPMPVPPLAPARRPRSIFDLPRWLLVATVLVSLTVGAAGITMFLVY